jgi:hypothetical protein
MGREQVRAHAEFGSKPKPQIKHPHMLLQQYSNHCQGGIPAVLSGVGNQIESASQVHAWHVILLRPMLCGCCGLH